MSPPRYAIGSEVAVLTLGRKRGVVAAIGNDGQYQVRIGGVVARCREDQLAPLDARRSRDERPVLMPPGEHTKAPARARLDLHGMTVEEARAAVLQAIDAAILDGADCLELVHGKGTGRLKSVIAREVPRVPSVRAVKEDPHNPGVTWVYF